MQGRHSTATVMAQVIRSEKRSSGFLPERERIARGGKQVARLYGLG